MNILNDFPQKGATVLVALLAFASPARGELEYALLPGSTITPYHNGLPVGPSEPMTGTFAWHMYTGGGSEAGFDATALAFQSASYLLTLDTSPANNRATSLFSATHTSYFGEIVDGVGPGIPTKPLDLTSVGLGTFEGTLENPTRLSYPALTLQVYDASSPYVAMLSLEAVQVPEPATAALIFAGVASLAGCRLIFRTAAQNQTSAKRAGQTQIPDGPASVDWFTR